MTNAEMDEIANRFKEHMAKREAPAERYDARTADTLAVLAAQNALLLVMVREIVRRLPEAQP